MKVSSNAIKITNETDETCNNGIDKQIIWEKWADPYGADIEETEWPGALDGPMEEETFDDGFQELSEEIDVTERPMKIILTPMGMVPLTEYTTPSRIFNFWVGHTNFSIDAPTKKRIEDTLGVEFFDLFSRYRFRIAIGKAFKDRNVMERVTQNLGAKPLETETESDEQNTG